MTPLKLVGAPKKLVIMLEDGRVAREKKTAGSNGKAAISPLAVKLNNFLQWSAAGCVLPYLSVYFLRYTQADSSHVGLVMSLGAIIGTVLNFVLGTLSDRYRAHRQFYLISLLLGYLSISIMFVPILKSSTNMVMTQQKQESTTTITTAHCELVTPLTQTTIPTPTAVLEEEEEKEEEQTIDIEQPVWFYIIGACIAFCSLSITNNQIFSDSFTANMARQCGSSYGSLRFYGALGWCVSNLILSSANSYLEAPADVWSHLNVPYLMPGWLLFAILSGANIALIACWPDRRPFDLSSTLSSSSSRVECEPHKTTASVVTTGRSKPVVLVRAELLSFDAFDERALSETTLGKQNMRRCSIAPLGSSHVVQIYEATCKGANNYQSKVGCALWSSTPADATEPHFKHITKIEPLVSSTTITTTNGNHQFEQEIKLYQAQQQVGEYEQRSSGEPEVAGRIKSMSLRLHMKIIELIARRNSKLVRCMALYSVIGFVMSANWNFLFPYMELLDANKFLTISGYVMISTYASETAFYYYSSRITSRVSALNGLSAILFFLAIRFSAYLAFSSSSSKAPLPLELMILVEALQSVTMGWFDCIFSEQALEFALEAEACVPQLIELGLIQDTQQARDQVTNGVKLSLMSLSSCLFDGIGVGVGSLIGGWLLSTYDFSTLWIVCVTVALSASAINVVLELTCFRVLPAESGASGTADANEQRRGDENKYQT